jgi:hypothetical protein
VERVDDEFRHGSMIRGDFYFKRGGEYDGRIAGVQHITQDMEQEFCGDLQMLVWRKLVKELFERVVVEDGKRRIVEQPQPPIVRYNPNVENELFRCEMCGYRENPGRALSVLRLYDATSAGYICMHCWALVCARGDELLSR